MSRLENQANQNANQAKSTFDNAKDKAGEVVDQVKQAGTHLRDQAREQIHNAKETATEYYEHGKERVLDWEEGLEGMVRESPIKALFIAAGVGMLLGIVWRRL